MSPCSDSCLHCEESRGRRAGEWRRIRWCCIRILCLCIPRLCIPLIIGGFYPSLIWRCTSALLEAIALLAEGFNLEWEFRSCRAFLSLCPSTRQSIVPLGMTLDDGDHVIKTSIWKSHFDLLLLFVCSISSVLSSLFALFGEFLPTCMVSSIFFFYFHLEQSSSIHYTYAKSSRDLAICCSSSLHPPELFGLWPQVVDPDDEETSNKP